ncbi:MAG: hypothetical protein HY684_03285 [Chloroflexi bacterium]|nr:hypothetical protein [Chloroflexota bacterium]
MSAPSVTTATGGPLGETYVALDLETTGLSPERDEIIEVGAVRCRAGKPAASFSSLVNPHRAIPPGVRVLTGIGQEEVNAAPPFDAVAPKLRDFLGMAPVVGQNIGFDLAFLARRGMQPAGPVYDTFEIASLLLPRLTDYSLESLARRVGVVHDRPHRALPDAQVTMQVFLALLSRALLLDGSILGEIARLAERAAWPLGELFRALEQWKTRTALFSSPAIGLEGYDAQALAERLRPSEGLRASARRQALDGASLAAYLAPDGPFARAFPSFEHRAEQVRMLETVVRAFNEGGRLLVEAGTGTGKSLAYLLPAILHSLRNGVPVVVSTNTINLQAQLVDKDIPAVLKGLEQVGEATHDFRYLSLKGRGNYLCLERWAALRRSPALTPDQARLTAKALVWLQETESGDRGELRLTPEEAQAWAMVSAQGDDLAAGRCALARQGLCFVQSARKRAEGAHVIVVNHALLLADAARGGGLLPEYGHLIIDEAHHLEAVATEALGFRVSERDIGSLLGRAADDRGVTGALAVALRAGRAPGPARADLEARATGLRQAVEGARRRLNDLFETLDAFIAHHADGGNEYDRSLRLTGGVRAQPDWPRVEAGWENLDLTLKDTENRLAELCAALKDLKDDILPGVEALRLEADAVRQAIADVREHLAEALVRADQSTICWLSQGGQDGVVTIHAAPLHVGQVLQEKLFAGKETVVLTSATLSAENSFGYIKERLGVADAEELLLGSPFDYQRAALVYVPTDLPEPTRPGYQQALADTLADLCRATGGYTLVLFTSHAALRAARSALQSPLERDGIPVLSQGVDGSPRHLLNAFKANPRMVLLGTASFWEGVDIGGETLKVLVLTRLPFAVPTEPVFAARSQLFDDPFSEYALPQTILRFKQGFGRLIRRRTDRGAVVVLDTRVTQRAYGAAFLHSLPPCTVKSGPMRDIPRSVMAWLAGKQERLL